MVKSIVIGPLRYRVVQKKLGNKWGCVDLQKRIIYLDEGRSRYDALMTLLHEALHGISNQTGVNQVMDDDELIVRAYENFICMLLRDNKTFSRELIREILKS